MSLRVLDYGEVRPRGYYTLLLVSYESILCSNVVVAGASWKTNTVEGVLLLMIEGISE